MTTERPNVLTRSVGQLRLHAIQAGIQKLDGGAMFGVVPKPLWERRMRADARNRIQLGMRCLLIEHAMGLVLIDTGLGNKESEKFRDIYGVENMSPGGRTWLEDGLSSLGFTTADVRTVINTHLHFDHAGGNTYLADDGSARPTFSNARYVVQEGELRFATQSNERTMASYLAHNWRPLIDARLIEVIEGETEVLPGIRVLPTPGHVPYHQSVLIDGGDDCACFLGDVCPTAAHLPLPWIMGYDVEPLRTLESKRWLLKRALEERWLIIFEHDFDIPFGRVTHDGKAYTLETETEI
jgi:glyoxylase-like metal-dependent hydrolase (beta-lactamase superfamily II)